MKPDSWIRVFELFRQAVALEEPERVRFLDSECAAETELRVEVERLLEEDSKNGGLLDRGLVPAVFTPFPESVPERIGAYTIGREIASGGMGTVYEAVQEQPRRTVALKTLRRFLISENAVKRFRFEGEVLGSLQHPGIAQIFEVGTYGDDQAPFIAMEYVAGSKNLIASARERGLDVRARIELFLDVCAAVHHGHQRGVIHRDLKPGNVLVDEHGRPKVIDFGLARVTDPGRHAVSAAETEAGKVVGTLQYMSPEQLDSSAEAADVLSDVYSLGVVLFELLSDELPYDLSDQGLAQMVALVRHEEPRRLGDVEPRLRGELEWITSRAMEKERGRRYASVHELAEDLRRHLRHEPVLAGPPSRTYQLRKFARRNRVLLTSVCAVIAALSFGLVRAELEARETKREFARAELEREKAWRVAESLRKTLTAVGPLVLGPDAPIIEVLEEAAKSVDEDFGDLPEAKAMVQNIVAKSYLELRRFDKAAEHLGAALAFVEENLERDAPLTIDVRAHQAQLLFLRSEWRACEALARELEPLALARFGEHHEVTLRIQATLGEILLFKGELDEAEQRYEVRIESLKEDGSDHGELIGALGGRALVWQQQGRLQEARAELERVLALAVDSLPGSNFRVWNARLNLAEHYVLSGDFAAAEPLAREALDHTTERYGADHPFTAWSATVLARSLHGQGGLEEALPYYEQAFDSTSAALGEANWMTLNKQQMFANGLRAAGEVELAEAHLRDALENGLEGEDDRIVLAILMALVQILDAQGRAEEAVEVLAHAYEERQALAKEEFVDVVLVELVNRLQNLERGEEAESVAREALAFHGPRAPDGHFLVPRLRQLVGTSLAYQERREEADEVLRAACAEARDGGYDDLVRDILINAAHNLIELGRHDEAEELYETERTATATYDADDWSAWVDEQITHLRTDHPRDE